MCVIVYDFDTNTLQETYPNEHWRNVDTDVRNCLVARGFEWRQGSTYFGDQTVDAVRCVRVVQKLAAKYPWFTPSARDIRMLRIEENNDPMSALDDQDDD